jgi:hypothetical protein
MRTLVLAAAALLCAWIPLRAQSGGDAIRQSLTFSLGALQENRRDDADSPLAYTGKGPVALIGYDWNRGARHWHLELGSGGANLTPVTAVQADTPPQETFNLFSLAGGMDWRLRGGSARTGTFALGFELATTVTLVRHLYPGQELSQQNFDFGEITAAPIIRWKRRLFSGELGASVAVPLLAWVDHPYSDVRFASQFSEIHFAPLSRFRQATGAISYTIAATRRTHVVAAYHLDVMQLDETERVHRVSQSLTVGLVTRLGVLK